MEKLRLNVRQALWVAVLVWLSSCAAKPGGASASTNWKGYKEEGKASYYSKKLDGNKMANGEKYRHHRLTAAHKKIPMGSKVKVVNTANNKKVKVTITDRGPYAKGRVIDLSGAAARKLDFEKQGVTPVKLKVVKVAR